MKTKLKFLLACCIFGACIIIMNGCKKEDRSSPSTTGTGMFWANGLGVGMPLTVTIQGVSGSQSITSSYSTQPTCSATGCAVYTLNPGTYNWQYIDSRTNQGTGTITITSGNCTQQRVN